MSTTHKSRISALLPTLLTREVKRASLNENISQSSIIETALYLWLKHRLDKDTKELGRMNFDDLPSEDEWLEIQTKI